MRRPTAVFPIVFALGPMIIAPLDGTRADGREEGPTEIEKCQTISQPGSYKLVKNLTFTVNQATCLPITTSNVTIDLAGFSIIGQQAGGSGDTRGPVLAGHRRAKRVDLRFL